MKSELVDLVNEEVWLAYVFVESPKRGRIVPLAFVSEYDGSLISGLNKSFLYSKDEIEEMSEEGSLIKIDEPVKITGNMRPFVFYEGMDEKSLKAKVYLVDKHNPVSKEGKVFLASYSISR